MKHLALISWRGLQDQGERILEAADWMGIPTRKITLGDRPARDHLAGGLAGRDCIVAISTDALALLREASPPDALRDFAEHECAQLLVFSLDRSRHHRDVLSWLTDGAVSGLSSPDERQVFRAPDSGRRFSRAFAGQGFALQRPVPVSSFDLRDADNPDVEKILLADDHPVFLRMRRGSCELFLLALTQLPDINQQLSPDRGVEDHYDQLIPLLIFLRHSFGDMCWHGAGSTARFIIDDPLLKPSYGFLDYGALRNSMRSAGYATSIAFIPWNHWRTSKDQAERALGRDSNLAICVHGCDHTNREFGDTDLGSLQWKSATALHRMERHEARTGLAFDSVMVFPQGKFSSSAMLALRTSGYLAAVNTTCFPTDPDAQPLTIADFLRPAITKFHGFPLFQRRYPRRLIDFAFDVFLGRPVLLVQHHEDFRDGYRLQEEFVDGLRTIAPGLAWAPLSDQLMQTCMVRLLGNSATEVRFFTRQFKYKNTQPRRSDLVFTKEEPDPSAVSSVSVGGINVPFSLENRLLRFEHSADAGEVIDVTILDRPRPPAPPPARLGLGHMIGVGMRRALSEFRDHTLVKYPRLLSAATGLATRLNVTGSSGKDART